MLAFHVYVLHLSVATDMQGCIMRDSAEILQFYICQISKCSLVCRGFKRQGKSISECFRNVSVSFEIFLKSAKMK